MSLKSLVKDSIVDGSQPEPKVSDKKPEAVGQESMEDLVARAKELGVVVTDDDSRAGILQKIEAVSKPAKTEDAGDDQGEKPTVKPTVKPKKKGKK